MKQILRSKNEKNLISKNVIDEDIIRKKIVKAKTIVLKFGTNSITNNNRVDDKKLEEIARIVKEMRNLEKNLVIVSSGAVACGMEVNNIFKRPKDVGELQDLAAEGQPILMEKYRRAFEKYKIGVWQLLLTHHNFSTNMERVNLIARIRSAFEKGKIPIINTNDPVTKEELVPVNGEFSFTDNDPLAGLVARFIEADLLLIVSNSGNLGSGGWKSKKKAIEIAKKSNCIVGICEFESVGEFLKGKKVGGVF
jgi:glutamate 5-kinase